MIFVFIRLTAFFASTNIIFPVGTPKVFKVAFSLFLSTLVAITIDINIEIKSIEHLINYGILETVTGLVLGYITSICFNSLKMGGRLIDQQLGLSMVNTYDPHTQMQSTLMENILYWMGVLVFFSIKGHHMLISGIQESFITMPIGYSILDDNFSYIVKIFVEYFIIGLKISVPIILALIITEIIMGLISRSVPQLNVMILGMPIKMLVGILFFITALPFLLKELHNLFNQLPNILDGTLALNQKLLFPVGVFLSTGDKTEEPTHKKKKDERKKGNVAKSRELINAITLCGVVLIIYTMSGYIISKIKILMTSFLTMDLSMSFDMDLIQFIMFKVSIIFAKLFLPIGLVVLILGVIGNVIQGGFLLTNEGLKPKISKINPISGFKNMFSMNALGNLVKSSAVIIVLSLIGYSFMKKNYEVILKSGDIYFPHLIYFIVDIVKSLLSTVLIVVIVIAVLDLAYQMYTHKKKLKMTKQEVKEEYKQMEGDPQIKSKIKQKQRQMANQRMMQAAKEATVIVTNPTHLSIAIRYEKGRDSAPIVVAKGADLIALKIREIANENDIPIIENKPLARMIYKKVDIDREIPVDMYQAVAEVLVAVYKIKNKYKKM